jgi:hypothetical protein
MSWYVIGDMKEYTIFLSADDSNKVYGVLSLNNEISDIFSHASPILVKSDALVTPTFVCLS